MATIHVALFFLILESSGVSRLPKPVGTAEVLELTIVRTEPPPVDRSEAPPAPSVPEIPHGTPGKPSAFIATPVGSAAPPAANSLAPLVVDHPDFDISALAEECSRAYPDSADDLQLHGSLLLVVKVDASGRPIEIKIASSSGSPDLDAAAGACVMSRATFVSGDTGASVKPTWHRLRWSR